MSDDRSDRLRRRRRRTKERSESEPSEPDETSKRDKPSKTDEGDDGSRPSVKDEQVGTFMYLPERQKREVERCYTVLKADYEYEFEEDFEKNRAFYPLLIEHGLSRLDEMSAPEARERLEEMDQL